MILKDCGGPKIISGIFPVAFSVNSAFLLVKFFREEAENKAGGGEKVSRPMQLGDRESFLKRKMGKD